MAELRLERRGVTTPNLPGVQGLSQSDMPAQNLEAIAQATAQQANDFQKKSEIIYNNKLERETRENLDDIFNNNPDDPEAIQNYYNKYTQGVTKGMTVMQGIEARRVIDQVAQPYISKALSNKNAKLTTDMMQSVEQNRDRILIDIQNNADTLLVPDSGLSEGEKITQGVEAFEAMEVNFSALSQNVQTIGPNGQPLYTPQQQAKILNQAKELMLGTATKKWFDQQPNKLNALRQISDGSLTIPISDGEKIVSAPLRDMFNPEIYKKVEKELMSYARQEMSIIDKIEKRSERINSEIEKQTASNLFQRAQDGSLTVEEVDRERVNLSSNDYLTARKMAKSFDVVTDGRVYNDLAVRATQGEDVFEEAVAAVDAGQIKGSDLLAIRNISQNKIQGFSDPVTEGIDTLTGLLGINPEIMKGVQTVVLTKATNEYKNAIESYIRENNRSPSRQEAIQIADEVSRSYMMYDINEFSHVQPAPKFGTDFKTDPRNLTVEKVTAAGKETRSYYFNKHNGDVQKASKDPDYIKQAKLLKDWMRFAEEQEERNARISARRNSR